MCIYSSQPAPPHFALVTHHRATAMSLCPRRGWQRRLPNSQHQEGTGVWAWAPPAQAAPLGACPGPVGGSQGMSEARGGGSGLQHPALLPRPVARGHSSSPPQDGGAGQPRPVPGLGQIPPVTQSRVAPDAVDSNCHPTRCSGRPQGHSTRGRAQHTHGTSGDSNTQGH